MMPNATRWIAVLACWFALGVSQARGQGTQPRQSTATPIAPSVFSTGSQPFDRGVMASEATDDSDSLGEVPSLEDRIAELEARAQQSESSLKDLKDSAAKSKAAALKLPSVTMSGAFQVDGVMFNQDDASREAYGRIESGADFRRARLGAKGAVSDRMDYFFQMDFGFFGRPTFTDVWADFKDVGRLGTVRVGQWKQPFSLEAVSSYRFTTMMERAGVFQAFVPFRHIGIGFYEHSEDLQWTWAASYLRTGQDQFAGSLSTDQGNGLAARATHLPWYENGGADYLHLGLGYFLNAPPNGRVRVRSIPEIFVGEFSVLPGDSQGSSGIPVTTVVQGTPFFVDTGLLREVSLIQTYGTESLWVRGPLSWQSEAMFQHIDTASVDNALLWGGYTTIGYFLTGEHRPYDRKAGAIDRVIPKHSVSKQGGLGAWEVAVRWSYLDLTDRRVRGGDMENITFGLNWYVNPYCKCVFNYIHIDAASRKTRSGLIVGEELIASTTEAYAVRCQVDF